MKKQILLPTLSEIMLYKSRVYEVYNMIGKQSGIKLDNWVQQIAVHLPEFSDDRYIYNTVNVNIRMVDSLNDPEGLLSIPVSLNDNNWATNLVDLVENIIERNNIDLVDYKHKSIQTFGNDEIRNALEFNIVARNDKTNVIRTKTVLKPPQYARVNKQENVAKWYDKNEKNIANTMINQLCGKSMNSIESIVSKNGLLETKIKECLISTVSNWNGFLNTYAEDAAVAERNPGKVATLIARKIINSLKIELQKKQPEIIAYYESNKSDRDESLWTKRVGDNIYKTDTEMFTTIADDVMNTPHLANTIIRIINTGIVKQPLKYNIASRKNNAQDEQHPLYRIYRTHFYKKYGQLPKNIPKDPNKAYPGDSVKTLYWFNFYSGRHVVGEQYCEMPKLRPIEEKEHYNTLEMSRLKPIEGKEHYNIFEIPRLKPIEEQYMPNLIPLCRKPNLVAIREQEYYTNNNDVFVDEYPNPF